MDAGMQAEIRGSMKTHFSDKAQRPEVIRGDKGLVGRPAPHGRP